MKKIFVYGTLRRGMYNYNIYLKDEDSFRGYGYIKGCLLSIRRRMYPGFILEGNDMVLGEIHEIDEEKLELIDKLEGYISKGNVHNEYNKVICDILDENQNIIDHLPVYVFNMDNEKNIGALDEVIVSGDYVKYARDLEEKILINEYEDEEDED